MSMLARSNVGAARAAWKKFAATCEAALREYAECSAHEILKVMDVLTDSQVGAA